MHETYGMRINRGRLPGLALRGAVVFLLLAAEPRLHAGEECPGAPGGLSRILEKLATEWNLDAFRDPADVLPPIRGGAAFEERRTQEGWWGYRGYSTSPEQAGYGPFFLQTQAPAQALRLGLVPHAASTLRQGRFEIRLAAAWVNAWSTGRSER